METVPFSRGLSFVFGLEALEVFCGVVEGVVNALAMEKQTVALSHGSLIVEPISRK